MIPVCADVDAAVAVAIAVVNTGTCQLLNLMNIQISPNRFIPHTVPLQRVGIPSLSKESDQPN